MRTRTWCVAAALSCVSVTASSQTVLTEADALARLSADSPRVRAIRAAVDVARADALAAGRWPNPRVTVNREAVAGITEHMAMVTQPLPVTGRRGLEVHAASRRRRAASSRADDEIRVARAELRARLRRSRVGAGARGRADAGTRSAARAGRRARAPGDGRRVGRATTGCAPTAKCWSRSSRAPPRVPIALRAQGAVAAFFAGADGPLGDRRGGSAGGAHRIAAAVRRAAPARAQIGPRRDGGPAARDADSARFAEQAAARRMVPEPEVVAGTKSSNAARRRRRQRAERARRRAALRSRRSPNARAPRAKMAQAEARADAFDAALRAQIAARARRRRRAARGRRSLSRRGRHGVERLERIALVSYEAGERGILELLDAHRTGSAARVRQVELDAAARHAEIELEWASGWEIR